MFVFLCFYEHVGGRNADFSDISQLRSWLSTGTVTGKSQRVCVVSLHKSVLKCDPVHFVSISLLLHIKSHKGRSDSVVFSLNSHVDSGTFDASVTQADRATISQSQFLIRRGSSGTISQIYQEMFEV